MRQSPYAILGVAGLTCAGLCIGTPRALAQQSEPKPSREMLLFLANLSAEDAEIIELAEACEDSGQAGLSKSSTAQAKQATELCPAAIDKPTSRSTSSPKLSANESDSL